MPKPSSHLRVALDNSVVQLHLHPVHVVVVEGTPDQLVDDVHMLSAKIQMRINRKGIRNLPPNLSSHVMAKLASCTQSIRTLGKCSM